jgi:hypothetical protein
VNYYVYDLQFVNLIVVPIVMSWKHIKDILQRGKEPVL